MAEQQFIYESRGNGLQHTMTEKEFHDFAKVIDPDGSKFVKKGSATPPEALDVTPATVRRPVAVVVEDKK